MRNKPVTSYKSITPKCISINGIDLTVKTKVYYEKLLVIKPQVEDFVSGMTVSEVCDKYNIIDETVLKRALIKFGAIVPVKRKRKDKYSLKSESKRSIMEAERDTIEAKRGKLASKPLISSEMMNYVSRVKETEFLAAMGV